MEHGGHGGDSVPTMPRCKMYMLWLVSPIVRPDNRSYLSNRNSDIIDTCVVFRWWHVRSYTTFVLTLLAIALLGVLYEYLRVFQRKLDFHIIQSLSAFKSKGASRGRDRSNSPRGGEERTTSNAFGEDNLEEVGLLSGRLLGAKATG
jgi:copper transporter 1